MAKSIPAHRKRGRPATGFDPSIAVRFPEEIVAAVETWATANDTTRSDAIRQLVAQALNAQKPKPKAKR